MYSKIDTPLHRSLGEQDWRFESDEYGAEYVWAPPEWGEVLLAPRSFVVVGGEGKRRDEQVLAGDTLPGAVSRGARRLAPDLAYFAWRDVYVQLTEIWVPPGAVGQALPEGRTWEMGTSAGSWYGHFTWRDGDAAPRGQSQDYSPVSPRIMRIWSKVLDWIEVAKEMRVEGTPAVTALERYEARGRKCLREGVVIEGLS